LFIRGGNSNFNKILVDGIPANDIGGGFDFAQLTTSGVERVEVLRETNSVRYGSDALSGVVDVTTRKGRTRTPRLDYSLDGGNHGTVTTEAAGGGTANRVDYFATYLRAGTDNQIPNNEYDNGTFAGRFGVALGRESDLTATIRRTDTLYGSPNGILLYGIPDDAEQDKDQSYVTAAVRSHWTDRWRSTVRFGWSDEHLVFDDHLATGEPYDPFESGFPAYLGDTVTVTGANGYSVTGRGILSYGGFVTDNRATRRVIAGDATYDVSRALAISAGARYEHEEGFNVPSEVSDEPAVRRNNGGVFIEGRGTLGNRHYLSAGLGYERNEVFESAVTPRISIASYLRASSATVGETKLTFNAGTGIKAPSVFQEQNALFELLQGTSAGGTVSPIGPERSRTIDVGVEQWFWNGSARARAMYFHNSFEDLLEYLSPQALVLAGVPPEAAAASGLGAYVNAASFRASGVELSIDLAVGSRLRVTGSYTFLDAMVKEAFGASPSFNPQFPGIPVGAYQALVGARPFRRPANSGSFVLAYDRGPAQLALSGHLVGKRDDSTFMTDQDFGTSMLLPNEDLAAAYQRIDLSGSYRVHPRLRGYLTIENLFDQDYQPAFGFPALPLTARVGFRLTLGGD
jgi:iron complex outermembrane receptor protein/vitamin B12 transporter